MLHSPDPKKARSEQHILIWGHLIFNGSAAGSFQPHLIPDIFSANLHPFLLMPEIPPSLIRIICSYPLMVSSFRSLYLKRGEIARSQYQNMTYHGQEPTVPKDGGQEPEEPISEHDLGKDGGQEPQIAQGALREGFYAQSCPQAENVVNQIMNKHFRRDPTLAAAIVRLFFHDCFVTGCDASILLDTTPTGEDVEKKAPHNGEFVRGYEAIDDIKTQLEAECPGVVSCADILAFANRDSLVLAAVPHYNVAAGRRDGLASLAKNVDQNLPLPGNSAQEIIQIFEKKGMTIEEMVVLSGAHSIGAAHCTVVADRFHDPEKSKEIDRGYLFRMQTVTFCRNQTQDIAFDPYSHHKMDSRFYKELLNNRALLESDHNLAKEPHAHKFMEQYAVDQEGWIAKFTSAIIKLGEIEVLTGNQGQIRKQCRAVN
ncbi:UNVERIFIED_CONTAM: Peroxidase 39 [Sesamum calycinum]|uniref:peroxidase n=1 Tax=Sesamum calycinum TaxID=2727403 RepID=A0AAW2QWP1_9LAMI